MLKDKLKRVKLFFYRYNPVKMDRGEVRAESLLPSIDKVQEGVAEPLTRNEIMDKAEQEVNDFKPKTIYYKVAKDLSDKGIAVNYGEAGWVSTGKTKLVLDENRVWGFVVSVSIALLILSNFPDGVLLSKTLLGFGILLAILSFFFWRE